MLFYIIFFSFFTSIVCCAIFDLIDIIKLFRKKKQKQNFIVSCNPIHRYKINKRLDVYHVDNWVVSGFDRDYNLVNKEYFYNWYDAMKYVIFKIDNKGIM